MVKAKFIGGDSSEIHLEPETVEHDAFMKAVLAGLEDLRSARTVSLRNARERLELRDPADR